MKINDNDRIDEFEFNLNPPENDIVHPKVPEVHNAVQDDFAWQDTAPQQYEVPKEIKPPLAVKKVVQEQQYEQKFTVNQPKKKNSIALTVMRVIFTILTVASILFIFSNSAEVAEVSGGKSIVVTEFLNKVLVKLSIGVTLTEHHVRKFAHFAEYAMLGFFSMLTLRVYTRRYISHISWPLFLCIAVPVLDESLQLTVDGRSGQLTDVLIDFSGSLCGIMLGLFVLLLFRAWWDGLHGREV